MKFVFFFCVIFILGIIFQVLVLNSYLLTVDAEGGREVVPNLAGKSIYRSEVTIERRKSIVTVISFVPLEQKNDCKNAQ